VPSSRRLRRARTLLAYWREGELVFRNFLTGAAITASPLAAQVLDLFYQWRSPEPVARGFEPYSPASVRRSLRELARHTVLVREHSAEARREAQFLQAWGAWHPEAGFFHFGTKDQRYSTSPKQIWRMMRGFLAESPQPAFFKRYPRARRVRLPTFPPPLSEFPRVLLARRTHRDFSPRPLQLQTLSELLFYTWGVTGFLDVPLLGRLPLKTSPSGGARHPIEVYIAALHVDGLPAGLYHYAPQHHRLELVRRGDYSSRVVRYCSGQSWVRRAAAVFVMAAALPRVTWKYRMPRAYRTVLLEAGHLCQTFCLAATWRGLAPFCTMALADSLVEKDLGLEGVSEPVIYLAGVGLPPRAGEPVVSSRRARRWASW